MTEPAAGARRLAVVDELRRQIIEGELIDGDRLDERELANQFEVSRVPIRESILILAAEGLVELRHHHGAFVAELTIGIVQDLFEVRAVLEPLAARLCALRAKPEEIVHLNALTTATRQAMERHDLLLGSQINADFHEELFRYSGNQLLNTLTPSVIGIARRVFRLSIVDHEAMMWRDHYDITTAIELGQADQAAELASAHLERTRQHTFELITERLCSNRT